MSSTITAICLLAPLTPAQAGGARYIQVEKVVTGTGSPGPFTIEVVCDVTASETFDLSDGESDVIQIQNQSSESCTVTETATLGADVSYTCDNIDQRESPSNRRLSCKRFSGESSAAVGSGSRTSADAVATVDRSRQDVDGNSRGSSYVLVAMM